MRAMRSFLSMPDARGDGADQSGRASRVIYRYGPVWGRTRHGFEYSEERLARLTPERRKILRNDPRRLPGTQFGVLH